MKIGNNDNNPPTIKKLLDKVHIRRGMLILIFKKWGSYVLKYGK